MKQMKSTWIVSVLSCCVRYITDTKNENWHALLNNAAAAAIIIAVILNINIFFISLLCQSYTLSHSQKEKETVTHKTSKHDYVLSMEKTETMVVAVCRFDICMTMNHQSFVNKWRQRQQNTPNIQII